MKKLLKFRITLRILFLVTLVVAISNSVVSYIVRKQMLEEAGRNANYEIDKLQLYTDQQLQPIETAAANMLSEIRIERYNLEFTYRYLEHFMESNPDVEEVFMAIDPKKYDGDVKEAWSAVKRKRGDMTIKRVYSDGTIRYTSQPWFQNAMRGKAGWSSPIVTTKRKILAPYTVPVYDHSGTIIGGVAVCISLDNLSTQLKESRPFKNAVVTIIDDERNILCHPDTSLILKAKVDTMIVTHKASTKAEILAHIDTNQRGDDYYAETRNNHKLIYYAPIEKTGWTILMQCDEKDIFEGTRRINLVMILALVFNLLVFSFLCWRFFKEAEKNEKQLITTAHLESELNTASHIQLAMLPKEFPPFPERNDIDVFASIRPAKAVGGDFYDYFIRDNKFFVTIGDVSGKGVPAALVMAINKVMFRIYSSKSDDPAQILTQINNAASRNNAENMFATMQIGCLDLTTGHLVYSNAGHNAPVLIHQNGASTEAMFRTPNPGLPVGCMPDFKYVNEEATVLPGSIIYMYTDGVTEAESADGQFFGDKRLLDTITSMPSSASVTEILEGVTAAVDAFANGATQSDDMTSLCFRFQPQGKNN